MLNLPPPPPHGRGMLPPGTFTNQVVMVTGGGTGLGKAMAVEFARLGAQVAIVSRDEGHRQSGVAAVTEIGGRALGLPMDVRHAEQIADAFEMAERELGPVSVLVNNAAGNFPVRAEDLSPNGWAVVVDIGLNGTFRCSREFAQRRIATNTRGAILNITSTQAWSGGPGTSHNAAAKAGITALTQSLAVEWAPYGIRVNCIAPGLFPHSDAVAAMRSGPSADGDESQFVPGGRVGQPHELGWAATYLCSDYASYVTGHTLVIDGGHWLGRGRYIPKFTPIADLIPKRTPK